MMPILGKLLPRIGAESQNLDLAQVLCNLADNLKRAGPV